MTIYQLNSLPDGIARRSGWGIRGLKLLLDSELHTPTCFALINIQTESDIENAMVYYAENSFGNATIIPSSISEGAKDAVFNTDLPIASDPMDAVQLEACLRNTLQAFNSISTNRTGQSFISDRTPKLSMVVQQSVGAQILGTCITADTESAGAILIRARLSNACDESAWHTYRVMEKDNHFFIENPAGDELLGSAMLTVMAKEARRCSDTLGFHLTLEWSIAEDQLFWLRACPTISEHLLNLSEFDTESDNANGIFTTSIVKSILPGAVTPLTLSTVGRALDNSVRQTMVRYKLAKKAEDLPQNNVVASFNNHLFINVSKISKIADKQPDGFKSLIEVSFCGEVLDESFSRFWDFTLTDFIAYTGKYFNSGNVIKDINPKIKSLSEDFSIILADKSLFDQIKEIDTQLEVLHTAFMDFFTILSTARFMSTALYLIFIKSLMVPEKARALMLKCLSDIHVLFSPSIIPALTTVARELVLDDPRAVNYSSKEIKKILEDHEGESRNALDAFIAEHGHRGFNEMELLRPSWQQRREDIVQYIQAILMTNLSESGQDIRVPGYLRTIDDQFEVKTASSLKNLIDQARSAIVISDLSYSMLARILEQFKAAYTYLGKQMADQKLILDDDLVFFMTHEELLDFLAPENTAFASDLAKKAYARKQAYRMQQSIQYGKLHFGNPVPSVEKATSPKGKILKGKCCTPGVSVGKARVISNLSDLEPFKSGEVMVISSADIGLVPFFSMACALVTEAGSELSPAAVVAREVGLPHITELADATRIIKTGDTLSINAVSGEITILN